MVFPDFSLTFPVCSKFPDFSLTGKCLPIFPVFPVRVGTLWYPSMPCSGGVCYPSMPCSRGDLLQGVPGPGGCLVEMTPRTATAAGGTHPTGMHSCSLIFFVLDPAFVSLYWSESESASRLVHSESNLIFKPCSDKDQRKKSLSRSANVNEPLRVYQQSVMKLR